MKGDSMNKLTGYNAVIPAYGRDYRNKADAIADFIKGQDFILQSFHSSGYVNIDAFARGAVVNIRYAQLRKIAVYRVA